MREDFTITLEWQRGYEFSANFGLEGVPPLLTDEGPPLGEGRGPTPVRLLAAAVGNCVSASLKFCLERSRIELLDLRARVIGTLARNERGRVRVAELRVHLEPTVAPGDAERMGRCLEIFEDFCIVGQSVRQGIDVRVEVGPQLGAAAALERSA